MQAKNNPSQAGYQGRGKIQNITCRGDNASLRPAPQGEFCNYGLTRDESKTILDFPNLPRPCKSLAHSQDGQKIARHSTAIHALADNVGKWLDHIGRAQRPGSGDTRAASVRLGSVVTLPYCFNIPKLTEA